MVDKQVMTQRIKEITQIMGVGGHEFQVANYIARQLKDHVDSLEMRPNGMLIARKKGTKPGKKVAVCAHMDEVGYIIKSITPEGFLYFDKIGEPTDAVMPGRKVLVEGRPGEYIPGIIGVRAGHLLTAEEMAKPQTVGQSYVDLCVHSRQEVEEMGIRVGTQMVLDSPCTHMYNPDFMSTRACDCRVPCAILVETMKNLKAEEIHGEIYACFTVLEESTVAGGAVVSNYVQPDYGIFLDTVPCGDVPDCDAVKELPLALEKGAALILSQQWAAAAMFAGSHPKLCDAIRASAKATGAKLQEFAFNSAAYVTDAVGAVNSGNGMAVVTLALPRRFSHSPVETFHIQDVLDHQAILEDVLKQDVDLNMLNF